MAKVKYFYDPETLSYRPIEVGKTLKVSNFFLFLISSLFFGVFTLFGLLSTDFLNTPKELLLERELNNYEFQFELLSQRLQQNGECDGRILKTVTTKSTVPISKQTPFHKNSAELVLGESNRYTRI